MASRLLFLTTIANLIVSALLMGQYLSGRTQRPVATLTSAFLTAIGAALGALYLITNFM